MHTGRGIRRSIAGLVVVLALACLLVLKTPPICEFASSRQMADAAACQDMPHKPPAQKSTAMTCAVPCAFADTEIAAPLPNMVAERAMHDASITKALRGIDEGPAPPPPRIHDRAAIHKI